MLHAYLWFVGICIVGGIILQGISDLWDAISRSPGNRAAPRSPRDPR